MIQRALYTDIQFVENPRGILIQSGDMSKIILNHIKYCMAAVDIYFTSEKIFDSCCLQLSCQLLFELNVDLQLVLKIRWKAISKNLCRYPRGSCKVRLIPELISQAICEVNYTNSIVSVAFILPKLINSIPGSIERSLS